MKRRDLILIAAVLLAAGALFAVSQIRATQTAAVVVATIDGKEALRVPLAEDGEYRIEQEDGALNVLLVEGGAARVIEANCRDGLCIRQGEMRSAAKTIVCLPHKLVISLEAAEEATGQTPPQDDLDVVVY